MKLKEYLFQNKLTLAAFANKVGTYPQAIHKYVHFEQNPKPYIAHKIVAVTDGLVTLADLYPPKKFKRKTKKMG